LFDGSSGFVNVTLFNVLIADNVGNRNGGGGLYLHIESTVSLNGVTITKNDGEGVYCFNTSNLQVTNSIISSNTSDLGQIYVSTQPQLQFITVSHSLIQGGESKIGGGGALIDWQTGNIDADPLFVDPSDGDYHLSDNSPAIGAGFDTSIAPITDIEGNPRPAPPGSNPDMGAYENARGDPLVPGGFSSTLSSLGSEVSGDVPLDYHVSQPSGGLVNLDVVYSINSGASWAFDPAAKHMSTCRAVGQIIEKC